MKKTILLSITLMVGLALISFGLFTLMSCQKNTTDTIEKQKITILKDGTTTLTLKDINTQSDIWLKCINENRSKLGYPLYTSFEVVGDSLVQSKNSTLVYILKVKIKEVPYDVNVGLYLKNNGDYWVGNTLVVCDCSGGGCMVEWYDHMFHCGDSLGCSGACALYAWVGGRPGGMNPPPEE